MHGIWRSAMGTVAVSVIVMGVAACGSPKNEAASTSKTPTGNETIKVSYSPAVQGALPFLPIEVARKKGYFQDEGISITVKNTDPSVIPAAISSGQLDMSADVTYNIARYLAKGLDVKLVAGLNDNVDFALVRRPDVDIPEPGAGQDGWKRSFVALKGKSIGVPGGLGGPLALTMKALLDQVGLSPGSYKLVAVGGPTTLSALKGKQIDVAVSGGGFDLSLVESGVAEKVLSFGSGIPSVFGDQSNAAAFVSAKALNASPDLAVKLQSAIARADKFIKDPANSNEVLSIAVKAGIPKTKHLAQRLDEYTFNSTLNVGKVNAALAWAHKAGIVSKKLEAEDAIAPGVKTS